MDRWRKRRGQEEERRSDVLVKDINRSANIGVELLFPLKPPLIGNVAAKFPINGGFKGNNSSTPMDLWIGGISIAMIDCWRVHDNRVVLGTKC